MFDVDYDFGRPYALKFDDEWLANFSLLILADMLS